MGFRVRFGGFALRDDESPDVGPVLFSFVALLLVELVVKLEFVLAAFLITYAEVGLRQAVVSIRSVRIQADSLLKLLNRLPCQVI